jgi:hypothetical protein
MIVSVLVHLLIVVLLVRHAIQWAQAGGGEDGPRGGGGGGSDAPARYVQLPASPEPAPATHAAPVPVPATPVAEPVPAPVMPPDVPVTPQVSTAPESSSASGTSVDGGGVGPGTGGGVGAGAGAGVGNDSGPGRGGDAAYITPPDPRTVLLPADCYKGHYTVRFWVEVDGSVSRVMVDPPPKSGGCRREVQDKMMGYQFHPARTRDGRAVAYVYQVQLTR